MATDAAATGKPVFVLTMDGRQRQVRAGSTPTSQARGVARPVRAARWTRWTYPPLDETDRAAARAVAPIRRPKGCGMSGPRILFVVDAGPRWAAAT